MSLYGGAAVRVPRDPLNDGVEEEPAPSSPRFFGQAAERVEAREWVRIPNPTRSVLRQDLFVMTIPTIESPDREWMIEEYKALRAEILANQDYQKNLLIFGTGVLAAGFGFVFRDAAIATERHWFLLLIEFLALSFWFTSEELGKHIEEIGAYIYSRIEKFSALNWELFQRVAYEDPGLKFQLLFMKSFDGFRPGEKANYVIVAKANDALSFKIITAETVFEKSSTELRGQDHEIEELKKHPHWDSGKELPRSEVEIIIKKVFSIVGYTAGRPKVGNSASASASSSGAAPVKTTVKELKRTQRKFMDFLNYIPFIAFSLCCVLLLLLDLPVVKIAPTGYDLKLMSSEPDKSGILAKGKPLVIVGTVGDVLNFRILDHDGEPVVESEKMDLSKKNRQIEELKKQLNGLQPPHELTESEKDLVVSAVTSIVGYTSPTSLPWRPIWPLVMSPKLGVQCLALILLVAMIVKSVYMRIFETKTAILKDQTEERLKVCAQFRRATKDEWYEDPASSALLPPPPAV